MSIEEAKKLVDMWFMNLPKEVRMEDETEEAWFVLVEAAEQVNPLKLENRKLKQRLESVLAEHAGGF
jgi:regulator of replication initiation timing